MGFRIGSHLGIGRNFVMTPWYAKSLGYDIFQIFLGSPQRILTKAKQKSELKKFSEELDKRSIKMVVHGSYTINLCHPPNSKKFVASLTSLVRDLNSTAIIGSNCLGVIIHMGKNIPDNNLSESEAVENYVRGLKKALELTPADTKIILETGASQGSEVCSKINGLANIYGKLSKTETERVYFCIDTCHIWATGYDISNGVGVAKFFREFTEKIPVKKIICIHLNDSRTKLNSHVDRHADLGYGFIKDAGLKAVAKFAKVNSIPLIMETPLDAVNSKTNRDITPQEELAKVKKWTK